MFYYNVLIDIVIMMEVVNLGINLILLMLR